MDISTLKINQTQHNDRKNNPSGYSLSYQTITSDVSTYLNFRYYLMISVARISG